jgi:hypothetical protein
VLEEFEGRIGLGPRYGYEVLVDLARPWVVPVLLVAAQGNIGDRTFPEPMWPDHTQCRPSQAGRLVLDAEARRRAPVPVGLINGSGYRGGPRPPLDPFAVLAALRRLLADPETPDGELLDLVGPPWSGGGCTVTGDLGALARGSRVVLRETGQITRTAIPVPAERPVPASAGPHHYRVSAGPTANVFPAHLVIGSLPARIVTTEVAQAIAGLASFRREDALPIADVRDESSGAEVQILLRLRSGADPVGVQDRVAMIEGMSVEAQYAFPAPLATLLRSWVTEHRGEDIATSLTDLELAIHADRQQAG